MEKIFDIALSNAVMAWDQASGETRMETLQSYACNVADTIREQGGDDADVIEGLAEYWQRIQRSLRRQRRKGGI